MRGTFAALNVIGGSLVLASYVHGLTSRPDAAAILWGGVPESLRGLYTVNMWLAAAGYFPFTSLWLFGVDPERVRFAGGFGYRSLLVAYALVLFPSALWLPLTYAWADAPTVAGFWLVRIDLLLVAAGTLWILAALVTVQPRPAGAWRVAGIVGALFFALQTVVLDGLIWPAYYPMP